MFHSVNNVLEWCSIIKNHVNGDFIIEDDNVADVGVVDNDGDYKFGVDLQGHVLGCI